MYSGYKMTERDLDPAKSVLSSSGTPPQREAWSFLAVEPAMGTTRGKEKEHRALTKNLAVGKNMALKPWRISRWLTIASVLALLLAIGGSFVAGYALIAPILVAVALAIVYRAADPGKTLPKALFNLLLALLAPLFALHLYIFDKVYLARGRLKR
jgi:hypothetical protein